MPDEQLLLLHLHELLSYLSQQGVLTLLIMAQTGILGETVHSSLELSYLPDTVVLMRFFEAFGEVRQAISTIKRRTGDHERSIRELRIGSHGVQVGSEIKEFPDPVVIGNEAPLISRYTWNLGAQYAHEIGPSGLGLLARVDYRRTEVVGPKVGGELIRAGTIATVSPAFAARRALRDNCSK